jgi:hypothetical protein
MQMRSGAGSAEWIDHIVPARCFVNDDRQLHDVANLLSLLNSRDFATLSSSGG